LTQNSPNAKLKPALKNALESHALCWNLKKSYNKVIEAFESNLWTFTKMKFDSKIAIIETLIL